MKKAKTRKVVFVAPLPPPVHGMSMMSDYIRRSDAINGPLRCRYVNISTARRMEQLGHNSPMKMLRYAASLLRLLWLLVAFRPDCCHLAITCHGSPFLKNAPYVLLCKLFGRRVIIHHHNKGMAAYVDRPLYRRLLPMVYRNATVVLLSWRLYPDVERVVARDQIRIIANGIPDTAAAAAAAAARRTAAATATTQQRPPQLLFLSNLIESKGVVALLDACQLLRKRGCRFTCRFVGAETAEIDRTRLLREVAARGLQQNVSFAGPRYGPDKEREIADSDIMVLPTRYPNECFPLVLLEAMAAALPIVASDEGAIADIVEDGTTGLIAATDPADLAQKLQSLLDDPSLRRRLGDQGRQRFLALFTLARYEQAIANLLQE